jgi:hypothetical protein
MSITRAQIATQLLNEMAPKGEKLAYINNREAELLKRMGGAGVDINKTGIKSYFDPGSGRGSVSESLNQAAFGSSGPTFSSDGGSESFTPKGNFATITKGGNDTQRTIPENYFTPSKTGTNIARVANFLINPSMFSKKFMDDKITEQYEKELKVAEDVTTARNTGFGQAIGSQYFGPMNTKAMQSYKNVVGGFPNTDPFVDTGGGDNQIIPRMQMIAQTPSDVESTSSDFDLYAALEGREAMRFGENPLGIMGAAQRFSEGGEVRQAYGLGKLVKKATKAVKKVVKSDLGKAALTAAAAYYAPALLGKSGYISGANPLFSATGKGGITDFLVKKGLGAKDYLKNLTGIGLAPGAKSTMSPTKRILTGLGFGATVAPFFMGGEEEDEETLDQAITRAYGKSDLDIPGIRRAALGYSDPNELYFKLPSAYRLNAAEGGITSIDVDDLPMSKEGSPKYYNPEGEEISFKEFEEAMKKEKQIMPKKKPSRTKKAEGGIASEDKVKMLIKRGADNDLIKTYVEGISDSEIEQIRNMMRADKAEGGLMNLGGNEMDLRGGGFVPIGAKEKADDVPARLSKNEFVFTADAVRAAGGGSIENGAQKMYNTMKQLEKMV